MSMSTLVFPPISSQIPPQISLIDLSVVIPAYNEAQRLGPTLARLHAFLHGFARGALRYELLVVDDGSSDGTAEVAEQLAQSIPHLRVIRSAPNPGEGAGGATRLTPG